MTAQTDLHHVAQLMESLSLLVRAARDDEHELVDVLLWYCPDHDPDSRYEVWTGGLGSGGFVIGRAGTPTAALREAIEDRARHALPWDVVDAEVIDDPGPVDGCEDLPSQVEARGLVLGEVEHGESLDMTFGPGNWIRHEGCPHAVEAGQTVAYHHRRFHDRPTSEGEAVDPDSVVGLEAVLHEQAVEHGAVGVARVAARLAGGFYAS